MTLGVFIANDSVGGRDSLVNLRSGVLMVGDGGGPGHCVSPWLLIEAFLLPFNGVAILVDFKLVFIHLLGMGVEFAFELLQFESLFRRHFGLVHFLHELRIILQFLSLLSHLLFPLLHFQH